MRNKVLVISIALMLVISLVISGCAKPAPAPAPSPAPAPAPAPEVFKWKMQSFLPGGTPDGVNMQDYFSDLVNRLSEGRLVISTLGAGEVVGAMEVGDAVSQGILEMGTWWATYDSGKDPVGALLGGPPFGWSNNMYWSWYYQAGGEDLMQEFYGRFNTHVLGVLICDWALSAQSSVPVASLEDMKGLKIRAAGVHAEILERLGAEIVMLPGGEVYTALETGIIDAAEFAGPSTNWGFGFHEVAPYVQTPAWHEPSRPTPFIVNKDAWAELPDDLKLICEVAMKATAVHFISWHHWVSASGYKKMQDYGCTITRLSDADLATLHDIMQEILDEYAAKDAFYAKVLNHMRDFQAIAEPYAKIGDVSFKR